MSLGLLPLVNNGGEKRKTPPNPASPPLVNNKKDTADKIAAVSFFSSSKFVFSIISCKNLILTMLPAPSSAQASLKHAAEDGGYRALMQYARCLLLEIIPTKIEAIDVLPGQEISLMRLS